MKLAQGRGVLLPAGILFERMGAAVHARLADAARDLPRGHSPQQDGQPTQRHQPARTGPIERVDLLAAGIQVFTLQPLQRLVRILGTVDRYAALISPRKTRSGRVDDGAGGRQQR